MFLTTTSKRQSVIASSDNRPFRWMECDQCTIGKSTGDRKGEAMLSTYLVYIPRWFGLTQTFIL